MDYEGEVEVARPLTEINSIRYLRMFDSTLLALQEYTEYDTMGAEYGLHKIKSRLHTAFTAMAAMIKRSDENLFKRIQHALAGKHEDIEEESVVDEYTALQHAIFELGVLLDKKNITKVDMKTARKKRGIERANKAKGYD